MTIFTDSKKLNISMCLGFVTLVLIIAAGVVYAYLGTLMPYHKAYTGLSEESVKNFNPELMYLISVILRLYGFLNIGLGVSLLFILFTGFRSKQKWAWHAFLIVCSISYFPVFIVTKPIIGALMLYKVLIVMGVCVFVQLAITYKEFFYTHNNPR